MKAKALIAALALLLAAGFTARAEGSWTVEETSYNSSTKTTTFTISRTETTYEQKVLYRTVGLTAYNGQHFTETYGELTFQAGTPSMTVQVTEKTSPANAYKFQQGSTERSYMLEVTDRAGYRLADCTRTMTIGSSVPTGNIFGVKDVTVNSGTITVTDDNYEQAYHAVSLASYYSASAPQGYLATAGVQLRMTLSFQAKEKDDGYQHVQILVNQTSNHDEGSGDNNPGTINYSSYMATFCHKGGSTNTTYSNYVFPVTSKGDLCGDVGTVWTSLNSTNNVGELRQQKFNTGCRASDGTLIIADVNASGVISSVSGLSSLGIRFDASGNNEDTWYAYNTVAHIEAIDITYPTKLAARVNPGRHAKGNPFYVSVAFSEIVTSTDATLSTSWGKMTLLSGSGTNVLTFKGTIKADADGALNISGKDGTISDLAGKEFITSINQDNLATLDADLAYTLNDFKQEGGAYLITCHDDLNGLAGYVNGGNNASGLTFRQVTNIVFPHTTNWNNSSSTENNFTAIGKSGNDSYRFKGTYDGEGHTISGIRIYKDGTSQLDNYQGLFGDVGGSGTVRNVILSDSRITGFDSVGGIAGYSFGTVEGCTVTANVCLHIVQVLANYFGGIVGHNRGKIYCCVSRACITLKSGISPTLNGFGGIAGHNLGSKTITDCIAEGVTIPNIKGRGVILGYDESGDVILTRNYYLGCTVAGVANATGVGQGTHGSTDTSDPDGAQPLWAVTLPAHTSLVRTGTNLPITGYATYDNGADIAGVPYAKATSTLNLSYDSAAISQGHDVVITAAETSSGNPVAVTDNGNHTYTIASMPAADITVTATEVPVVSYIDADGMEQNCTNFTVIQSSNSDVTLGSSSNSQPAWYVVPAGTVTVIGKLWFYDRDVRLIVCDGATLNVTRDYGNTLQSNGSLTIYGQAQQSGILNAYNTSNNGNAIHSTNGDINNITINGGIVSASANGNAIDAFMGNITINRGIVSATGGDNHNGIHAERNNNVGGNITINGGTVSATGNVDGIYAYGGGIITLGCATAADRITASSYAGTVVIADGQTLTDGTEIYSSTLSLEEKAAIAGKTLQSAAGAVFYIDADGVQRVCVGATQITSSSCEYGNSSNAEGWYYVSGEVSLNSRLVFSDQNVHLILCDGANLKITSTNNYGLVFSTNGSIYGQSGGSGILDINSLDNALANSGSRSAICINGGEISVDSSGGDGIYCYGEVIIRRGIVTAKGTNGIRGRGISILGGKVTATGTNGSGIFGTLSFITLGWSNSGDSITASSYLLGSSDYALLIATGQALTDGTDTYTGLLNTEQIAAIAGKTLRPAVNPSDDNLGLTARKSKFGGISKYFTTFYHPTKNYKLLDGAQAFTLNGSKQFYRIGDGSIVPKECAVIIFADKPVVSLKAIDISTPPSPVGTNILQGVGVATAVSTLVTGSQKVFVVSGNNNGIGLNEFTGTTIPAYKAYIVE